jgi:MFS family permease
MAESLKSPAPAWRWAVLTAVSVAMFGNYYAYDAVAPLADMLQKDLGFSNTQIGTLNAIYNAPNLFMVFVGGIIIDRIGTKLSTLIFAVICFIGTVVTAATDSFPVMAAGRLIFGLGAESMIVAVTVAIGQWFVGRQLGLAFGVNLSIARAGSYAADRSPTFFRQAYESGWQAPLWIAAGFAAIAVAACVVYYFLTRAAEQRFQLGAQGKTDRIVWSDIWRFDRSYWYIVGLCVTFYSVIFPFRSTFAIMYFQHAHGLTLEDAGAMNGYVFLAAIFATPVFGYVADKLGNRAGWMALSCALLAASFPILAYTNLSLWVSTVLIGIAFSLVPAVLWPAVPYLVPAARLGTAYGLMTMLQNIGWLIVNLVAGMLNDAAGAGPDNPGGYTAMLVLFFVLSLSGFAFAAALRTRETSAQGHGLESIRAAN